MLWHEIVKQSTLGNNESQPAKPGIKPRSLVMFCSVLWCYMYMVKQVLNNQTDQVFIWLDSWNSLHVWTEAITFRLFTAASVRNIPIVQPVNASVCRTVLIVNILLSPIFLASMYVEQTPWKCNNFTFVLIRPAEEIKPFDSITVLYACTDLVRFQFPTLNGINCCQMRNFPNAVRLKLQQNIFCFKVSLTSYYRENIILIKDAILMVHF